MRVTDIVNSAKLTVGQIFSCPTVQHFQFELLRVSAALTHETGTAMVLVCRHPTSDEAVSDAVFGCEDFVSPFAREVVPNHFQFEPEVEFPHMPSKVVSTSWGSVHFRGDSSNEFADQVKRRMREVARCVILEKIANYHGLVEGDLTGQAGAIGRCEAELAFQAVFARP